MIVQNVENKQEKVEYNGKTPLKGKRETFAQLVATGTVNQTEAHKQAGYKHWNGSKRYAYELATNPVIKARIAYIKVELAKKWDITKDSQVKEYIGIRDRAITAGDLRAEISANNSIDKLCGLIVDKIQTDQTDTQKARTAAEERLYAEFSDYMMKRKIGSPEAVTEVILDDV